MNIKSWFKSKKPVSSFAQRPTFKESMNKVLEAIPGGGITVTTVTLTAVSLTIGHFLGMACVGGIVLSVSIGYLYIGSPEYLKKGILWVCAHGGWYIDVAVTVLLTLWGLTLGATIGIVTMVLGLYISTMMSIARWIYQRNNIIRATA